MFLVTKGTSKTVLLSRVYCILLFFVLKVDVAVKSLHSDIPLTNEALEDLGKEADAMAMLTSETSGTEGSKHILKMYGVCNGT